VRSRFQHVIVHSPGVAMDSSRADEIDKQFDNQLDLLSRLQVTCEAIANYTNQICSTTLWLRSSRTSESTTDVKNRTFFGH